MTKATRLARALASGQKDDPPKAAPSPDPSVATQEQLAWRGARYDNLIGDLRLLATRDDGWLRVIPDSDRQLVHLKWKFTRGRWSYHYVYAQVEDLQVAHGLSILIRKLLEVDDGTRKPTPDRFYHQDGEA